jgi:predicted oxidoreductase
MKQQDEVSILELSAFKNGILDACQAAQVTPTAWSPLGGGNVFRYNPGGSMYEIKNLLKDLAADYGCGVDQLLLAFLLKHPTAMVPVLGTTKLERIASALDAYHVNLNREDWYRLWQASTGHEVP